MFYERSQTNSDTISEVSHRHVELIEGEVTRTAGHSGEQWKPESESSSDEERSTSASVERSPCAVNMTVSPTSLLSDEHSSNDVSSTTDCAIIPSVRIDSIVVKVKNGTKNRNANFILS